MSDTFRRVARPENTGEPEEARPANAIRRNTLTLYISFAAIILSCASAGVNLFTFFGGGQQKMVNEADQILTVAEANRVLRDLTRHPESHQELQAELRHLYKTLNYRPPSDTKLDVFELAAFGVVVQNYALPLVEVQLRQVQARQSIMSLTLKDEDGKTYDWKKYDCRIDPALCSESNGK